MTSNQSGPIWTAVKWTASLKDWFWGLEVGVQVAIVTAFVALIVGIVPIIIHLAGRRMDETKDTLVCKAVNEAHDTILRNGDGPRYTEVRIDIRTRHERRAATQLAASCPSNSPVVGVNYRPGEKSALFMVDLVKGNPSPS